jgi:hypothetical protein
MGTLKSNYCHAQSHRIGRHHTGSTSNQCWHNQHMVLASKGCMVKCCISFLRARQRINEVELGTHFIFIHDISSILEEHFHHETRSKTACVMQGGLTNLRWWGETSQSEFLVLLFSSRRLLQNRWVIGPAILCWHRTIYKAREEGWTQPTHWVSPHETCFVRRCFSHWHLIPVATADQSLRSVSPETGTQHAESCFQTKQIRTSRLMKCSHQVSRKKISIMLQEK